MSAIASVLTGVASGRIYRSRREQINDVPSVVIEPVSETAVENVLGYHDRRLTVDVSVYAKGDTPDNAADATLSACWTALAADTGLGQGNAVQLEPGHDVAWDFENYDYVRAVLRVTVNYRTAFGSM